MAQVAERASPIHLNRNRVQDIWNVVPFGKGRVMVKRDEPSASPSRTLRSDAQRNLEALLEAAKEVFAEAGVDAPVRDVAARAGVGLGTVYRRFPTRADLVAAVFRREIDACADAGTELAETHGAFDALAMWMQRFADFLATKRGLASALHSGDSAFATLPTHFDARLRPALDRLLVAAIASGEVQTDITADELLGAIVRLCSSPSDKGVDRGHRLVTLLANGLRTGS